MYVYLIRYYDVVSLYHACRDESYDIDMNSLSRRYKQLQGVLHPDRHVASGQSDTIFALENSSVVNKAYDILGNYNSRAKYLVSDFNTLLTHLFIILLSA